MSSPDVSPPAYEDHKMTEQTRLFRFQDTMQKYEISPFFADKLRQLEGYNIIMVCDDSGSMNTPVTSQGSKQTRWTELKGTATIIMELACLLTPHGMDLYFLNRPPIRGVTNTKQVEQAFVEAPRGATPLTATLRRVMADHPDLGKGDNRQKYLIVVATDGEPASNDRANPDSKEILKKWLLHERHPVSQIWIEFLACTDDDRVVGYLNEWDNTIPNFDVTDDYASERTQILKVQGRNFPFSYGDYVVKCLLGSIDKKMDSLDERAANNGCCIIS